jgi:hypothetical protein
MSEYALLASPVDAFPSLPARLMCYIAALLPADTAYGTKCPGYLMRAAWDDAGYCLDAPDEFPAGGCYAMDLPPLDPEDTMEYFPAQLTIEREPHDLKNARSAASTSSVSVTRTPDATDRS